MLSALVRRAQFGTGSKMTAYDAVGSRIGASGSWVRKALGRQPVGLNGHVLDNIRSAYARICDRIEAAADAIEAGNDELRRDLDAALGGDHPSAVRCGGTSRAAAEASPARGSGPAAAPAPVEAFARTGEPAARDLSDLPLWRGRLEE